MAVRPRLVSPVLVSRVRVGRLAVVGFPGETEADFAETVRFIEALPFTYLHVFTYSERQIGRAHV